MSRESNFQKGRGAATYDGGMARETAYLEIVSGVLPRTVGEPKSFKMERRLCERRS